MALTEVDAARLNDNVFNTVGPFKNRIINGDMRIDQRNAGASVTPTAGVYCIDRWNAGADASSKYSIQQVSDAPAGFSFSAKITSLSAYTVGSAETFGLLQWIEGFNTADLAFGTASAKTISVSFWVKSSLTGAFGGSVQNSGYTRSYPFSYTISAANTWEYKTITIPGDTTGTWVGATNGQGMLLYFSVGSGASRSGTAGAWTGTQYSFGVTGATSVVGTNGATFYITGVQLEAGSVATPFERRSYGQELSLCQRYYQFVGTGYPVGAGMMNSSTAIECMYFGGAPMRAAPTVACSSSGSTALTLRTNNQTSNVTGSTFSADLIAAGPTCASFRLSATAASAIGASGYGCIVHTNAGQVTLSSEL